MLQFDTVFWLASMARFSIVTFCVFMGIAKVSGAGTAGGTEENNEISNNAVNDAYCGVFFVATIHVTGGKFSNILFPLLLSNTQPVPPAAEPPIP